MRSGLLHALLAAWLVAGPGLAAAPKDLELVPETSPGASTAASPVAPPAAGLRLRAWTDRTGQEVSVGESLKISVQPTADCYAYVICVGTSGKSDLLFPNRKEPDNRVGGGQERAVPGNAAGYRVAVAGPPGTETLLVLACARQLDVYPHLSLIAPRRTASALTLTGQPTTLANKDLVLEGDDSGPPRTVRFEDFLAEVQRTGHVTLDRDLAVVVVNLNVKGATPPVAAH